jgi:diacylglycerol O-acyltransferase
MALIERVSGTDLLELATDLPDAPKQVGMVLLLESPLDLHLLRTTLAERIAAVPRLRQRLKSVPFGCGRPIWVDDPRFDIQNHVTMASCPAPGDETALLSAVAGFVQDRLAMDGPLWRATLLTGLANGGAALALVVHHVLTDGIGGLAMLSGLLDSTTPLDGTTLLEGTTPAAAPPPFPRPAPTTFALLADAQRSRLKTIARLPALAVLLARAVAELTAGRTPRLPQSSLNQPTGPERALAVATTNLQSVRTAAHACDATVNDAVLTAVAGALRTVLAKRGETTSTFVVTVPISARRRTTATHVGNAVGIAPVGLSATGDLVERLTTTARTTRARRTSHPGASAALLAPLFRLIAKLGLLHWFIDHQRMTNTFVTNLRGPGTPATILGTPIRRVLAVPGIAGNITVAFAAFSYAGTLELTILADPTTRPDLHDLKASLQTELDDLTMLATR